MHHHFARRLTQATTIALTLAATHLSAHALVEAGHWGFTQDPNGQFGNFAVRVDQTVGGDYTGTFFDYDALSGRLTYKTQNLDEGSAVWVTQAGAVIDNSFSASIGSVKTTVVGTDFYLGAATSSSTDPGFSWNNLSNRTSFGWAHFRADSTGKLTLVDSAMAFREPGGIVVGTLTTPAVPEPSTWALLVMGLTAIAGIGRHRTGKRTAVTPQTA